MPEPNLDQYRGYLRALAQIELGRRLQGKVDPSDIVQQTMLEAYRLQYILSGARHPHFASALASLTTDAQLGRVHDALNGLSPIQSLAA